MGHCQQWIENFNALGIWVDILPGLQRSYLSRDMSFMVVLSVGVQDSLQVTIGHGHTYDSQCDDV